MICAGCQADLGRPERVGRRDTCPRCHGDLHTCRQCRFYDPRTTDACREPQAERVLDATRANFCDYFSAAEAPGSSSAARAASGPEARAAGDSDTRAAGNSDARAALDRLFKR